MKLNKTNNVDTTKAITHIGLCAGYGGIELGLKRVIPNMRSVALCEIEAFACANLVAKMEAGLMEPAPIWSNLKTFPWAEFSGRVDILTGGYPCQPFSAAGKRAGKDDPRHLWPWIADGIRLLRPRMCFFENVEGHISLGLSDVIEDLAGMGYRTTFGIFSASEVGAPHQRKRVFILAHDQRQRIEELHRIVAMGPQQHPAGDISSGWRRVSFAADCNGYDEETGELGSECSICGCDYTEDCECPGPTQDGYEYAEFDGVLYARPEQAWPSRPGEPQHGWEPPRVVGNAESQRAGRGHQLCGEDGRPRRTLPCESDESGEVLADTNSQQSQRGRNAGKLESTPDPKQGETQKRERSRNAIGNQGSAGAIVGDARGQESSGLSSGRGREQMAAARESGQRQAQPALGRDADGTASRMDYAQLYVTFDNRTDELRLLGNGVVPATAERAFRVLMNQTLV